MLSIKENTELDSLHTLGHLNLALLKSSAKQDALLYISFHNEGKWSSERQNLPVMLSSYSLYSPLFTFCLLFSLTFLISLLFYEDEILRVMESHS